MRHIIFVISLFLISVCSLWAQTSQKVRVMEYRGEKNKTPLADVEVVVGNAGSAATDKNGLCTLQFRSLKAGDKVSVRQIYKPGYEVLTPEKLEQWFVANDQDEEYVIVMVSSKRIKAERAEYSRTAEKALAKEKKLELALIEKRLKDSLISKAEYEKKIKLLEDEYYEKLDNIDNFIDNIVHTDVNELAEREKKTFEIVKSGNFSGALARYEEDNLLETYRRSIDEKKELEEASDKLTDALNRNEEDKIKVYLGIRRQNELYRIAGGRENIEAGLRLWHDFAYADTTFLLPMLEYAQYCEASNRIDQALDAVKYCLNSTDTATLLKANLLHMQLLTRQEKYREAVEDLQNAYHYMDSVRVAKADSDLYLIERAYTLTLLCKSYTYLRDYDRVRRIRRLMVETNREAYEWNKGNLIQKRYYVESLYAAHYSLAMLYNTQTADRMMLADSLRRSHYLDDAIALQEELYATDPVKQAATLAFLHSAKATAKSNIASADKKTPVQLAAIEAEYLSAIELYKQAYEHNPVAYAHYVASLYNNYARLYVMFNQLENKEKVIGLFLKAKKYGEQEIEYNASASHRMYAYTLYGLGNAYLKYKDYDLALQHLVQAEEDILPLYRQYPKTYRKLLRQIYNDLKKVYSPECLNDKVGLTLVKQKLKDLDKAAD